MNKNGKIVWWVKIQQELLTQPLDVFRNNVFFSRKQKTLKDVCRLTEWHGQKNFTELFYLTAPFFGEVWIGSEELFQIQIQQKL